MTLTDIMPTLRMSIPDPIDLFAWPPGTAVTTDDVAISRLSMVGVAGLLGTPCEWSTEESSPSGCRTVLICTVSAVVHDSDDAMALIDCGMQGTGALFSHARLIGRISVAHKGLFGLLEDGSRPGGVTGGRPDTTTSRGVAVSLPRDLTAGDLVIVPCLPVSQDAVVIGHARVPADAPLV